MKKKPLTIFLISSIILTLSFIFIIKNFDSIYNRLTFEECENLKVDDIKILNNFFKGNYNGDKDYWCKLTKIKVRFLYKKDLTIPKQLGNLKNLRYIELKSLGLIGEIPKELGNLKKLEVLLLNDNKLTGEIPESLLKLSKLKVINLTNNKLQINNKNKDFINKRGLIVKSVWLKRLNFPI